MPFFTARFSPVKDKWNEETFGLVTKFLDKMAMFFDSEIGRGTNQA